MRPLTEHFGVIAEHGVDPAAVFADSDCMADLIARHRCVVLRGYGMTIGEFAQITSSVTCDFDTYQGGGFTTGPFSRATLVDNATIMTATGKSQDFPMSLHGEMYYMQDPPDLIWFFCETSVADGGETTVGDGIRIFRDLSPAVQRMFLDRGICYQRHLPEGSWQQAFRTDNRAEAQRFCHDKGLQLAWQDDGAATTRFVTRAVRQGEGLAPAFINSVLLLAMGERVIGGGLISQFTAETASLKVDFVVRWADGSPIAAEVIDEVNKICTRNEIALPWQAGDMVAIDNRTVMHGRRGTASAGRKILVRMGKAIPAQMIA